MEMKFVHEEWDEHFLIYYYNADGGYSFPIDKDGNLLNENPAALERLAYCKAHPELFVKNGEVETVHLERVYGICPHCGNHIYFDGNGYIGAYQCDCGQWYNRSGQELLPPDEWDMEGDEW